MAIFSDLFFGGNQEIQRCVPIAEPSAQHRSSQGSRAGYFFFDAIGKASLAAGVAYLTNVGLRGVYPASEANLEAVYSAGLAALGGFGIALQNYGSAPSLAKHRFVSASMSTVGSICAGVGFGGCLGDFLNRAEGLKIGSFGKITAMDGMVLGGSILAGLNALKSRHLLDSSRK